MAGTFDDLIIRVWRQTLIQNEKIVELADKRYFVNELRGTDFAK